MTAEDILEERLIYYVAPETLYFWGWSFKTDINYSVTV